MNAIMNYQQDYFLTGDERKEIMTEVARHNPRRSFPTIVIDDATVVVGFQEARLRELLDL